MRGETFKAISHPFRVQVLEMLSDGQIHPTAALAHGEPMTKAAISQHLKILRESGLVIEIKEGREKRYCLDPSGIAEILAWAETFQLFWTNKMRNLAQYMW